MIQLPIVVLHIISDHKLSFLLPNFYFYVLCFWFVCFLVWLFNCGVHFYLIAAAVLASYLRMLGSLGISFQDQVIYGRRYEVFFSDSVKWSD